MYSLLLALIYLAFVSLGLPDSLLGSAWPVMHEYLSVPLPYMGIVSMTISGGTIVSSLLSDRVTRKFGTPAVTALSVFLTAAALFGFSFSTKFYMLIVFAVPYGLGAGAIDAALNNYVAQHYSSRHMSWLHCFWGVGTIISPFVMSLALTRSVWNDGYRTVGFIQIGIGLILLLTIPVWKINEGGKISEETEKSRPLGLFETYRIRGVPTLLLGFFAYCAAESTAMSWASTYTVEVKGVGDEAAAGFGSLFFIGLTVGRFLGGFITNKLGDRKMILLGTSVLTAGLVLLALPVESLPVSLAGFVVIGFGCAPIYPCIIHSTPENFGADKSQAIIGIQMASAYLGSTFMPPLFGVIANKTTFRLMPYYLAFFFILMVTMTELTFRITEKKH